MFALVLTACQDKDIDREAMKLNAPDVAQITGQLSGDDYIWTWPAQTAQMRVTIYRNGTISSSETVSGNATSSLPELSTGVYVLRLVNGERVRAQKIVIE